MKAVKAACAGSIEFSTIFLKVSLSSFQSVQGVRAWIVAARTLPYIKDISPNVSF